MPGAPHLYMQSASQPAEVSRPSMAPAADGASHAKFTVWVAVYALAAIAILGGLKVGGFSFVFKSR